MNKFFIKTSFFTFLICSVAAFADHPGEGSVILEDLIKEAQSKNLELKEAENVFSALSSNASSKYAAFSPKLYIESGPMVAKFEDENSSGVAVYLLSPRSAISAGDMMNLIYPETIIKSQVLSIYDQNGKFYEKIHPGTGPYRVAFDKKIQGECVVCWNR